MCYLDNLEFERLRREIVIDGEVYITTPLAASSFTLMDISNNQNEEKNFEAKKGLLEASLAQLIKEQKHLSCSASSNIDKILT